MITTTFEPKTGPQVGDYVKTRGYNPSGQRVGRVAAISDTGLLVEFPKSHRGLHNGASFVNKSPKCKEQHGWWVPKDEVEPLFIDAVVFKDGDQTYCQRAGKKRVTGIATRSDNDANKPFIGAFIALARAYGLSPVAAAKQVLAFSRGIVLGDGTQCLPATLELLGGGGRAVTVMATMEPKTEAPTLDTKKKVKVIRRANYLGPHSGIVGTPTDLVDAAGHTLSVGDVVEIWTDTKGVLGEDPVVQDENHTDKFFVMGCAGKDFTKSGADGGFRIRKVKSHIDLRLDEKLSDGRLVIKEEEVVPGKKMTMRSWFDDSYGVLGEPTPLVDRDGRSLRIGDVVEFFLPGSEEADGEVPICFNKEYGPASAGGYYPMGLGGHDFRTPDGDCGFRIRKTRYWTELKPGDKLSDGWLTVKEED